MHHSSAKGIVLQPSRGRWLIAPRSRTRRCVKEYQERSGSMRSGCPHPTFTTLVAEKFRRVARQSLNTSCLFALALFSSL